MSMDRVGGVVTKAVVVGRFFKFGRRKDSGAQKALVRERVHSIA